jgi:RNA polymerase sigma-70 factor (ECF subfamily)
MADIPPTRVSLLVRLRDPRDDAAWAQFVKLYGPIVYGYARKQGLQEADAADLSQEVLRAVAGAVSHLEYDPRRGAFRNWLFTVVRRKLASWRRARSCRPDVNNSCDPLPLLEQRPAAEPAADWDTEWEQRVFAWACSEVRQEVSDITWQAFWRTAIEDQPGKQVAADLGISAAAVYNARSRIRARLKQLVQSVQEP